MIPEAAKKNLHNAADELTRAIRSIENDQLGDVDVLVACLDDIRADLLELIR